MVKSADQFLTQMAFKVEIRYGAGDAAEGVNTFTMVL